VLDSIDICTQNSVTMVIVSIMQSNISISNEVRLAIQILSDSVRKENCMYLSFVSSEISMK
jgi:hypothetical protein